MMSHDLEYYARRAEQERQRALLTKDATARLVHQEMAARYRARVSEMAKTQPAPQPA